MIYNSRPQRRTNTVWRRHRCTLCDTVFSSVESIDYHGSIKVAAQSAVGTKNQLTAFNRDKLLLSLYKSLGHRQTALEDAGGLCATISAKIVTQSDAGIIQADQIIAVALVALRRFDELAARHYQAMHSH